MGNTAQDIRFAVRIFVKNPGFTVILVVILAIGTGANTAIFSVLNAILFRPLPYRNPSELVLIWENNLKSGVPKNPISPLEYLDYSSQNQVFDSVACFFGSVFNLSERGEPETISGSLVSANFFSVLGVGAAAGRVFSPGEDQSLAERPVVISHALWQRRYAADPNVAGTQIRIDGANFTVIGVTPRAFEPPTEDDELWIPLALDGGDASRMPSFVNSTSIKKRGLRFLAAIARTRADVTISQAQKDVEHIAQEMERAYPDSNTNIGVSIVSLREELFGDVRTPLSILFISVGLVLLIACVNVANMLLAKALTRQREMAIRSALGASGLRLFKQLVTEGLILSLFSSACGLLVAYGCIKLLIALNPPNIPRLKNVGIDFPVLAFSLIVSVIVAVLFVMLPALFGARTELSAALAEGPRSIGSRPRRSARRALLIFEVVLAQVLLIAAVSAINSFWSLQKTNPGFNA